MTTSDDDHLQGRLPLVDVDIRSLPLVQDKHQVTKRD